MKDPLMYQLFNVTAQSDGVEISINGTGANVCNVEIKCNSLI
jgi:hypothetical protein